MPSGWTWNPPGRAGALGLQHAVELRGPVLGTNNPAGCCRRWRGRRAPVLVDDLHRLAVEEVAVLPEDVGFRSLPHHGVGRQDEDVLKLLDRDMQPHLLAGAKPPEQERLPVFLEAAGLVGKRQEEGERPARRVDRVGDVPDVERLLQRGPAIDSTGVEC